MQFPNSLHCISLWYTFQKIQESKELARCERNTHPQQIPTPSSGQWLPAYICLSLLTLVPSRRWNSKTPHLYAVTVPESGFWEECFWNGSDGFCDIMCAWITSNYFKRLICSDHLRPPDKSYSNHYSKMSCKGARVQPQQVPLHFLHRQATRFQPGQFSIWHPVLWELAER